MKLSKKQFLKKYKFPDDEVSNHIFCAINGLIVDGMWDKDHWEEYEERMKTISKDLD